MSAMLRSLIPTVHCTYLTSPTRRSAEGLRALHGSAAYITRSDVLRCALRCCLTRVADPEALVQAQCYLYPPVWLPVQPGVEIRAAQHLPAGRGLYGAHLSSSCTLLRHENFSDTSSSHCFEKIPAAHHACRLHARTFRGAPSLGVHSCRDRLAAFSLKHDFAQPTQAASRNAADPRLSPHFNEDISGVQSRPSYYGAVT